MQLAALAIALLLIVLAVRGFNQIGPEPARSPALASDLNALEAEFRDLTEEAVEVISERAIELNLP